MRHLRTCLTSGGIVSVLLLSACSLDPAASPNAGDTSPVVRDEVACRDLAGRMVPGGKIDTATYVKTGDTTVDRPPFTIKASASFCRVAVTLSSGPGSVIKSEYWLPDTWNRKFYAVGGGGFSGGLEGAPLLLTDPLAQGYAGASSDAGHTVVEGAQWAHNEPIKLADWANRANHATAVFGKTLIAAYYAEAPRRSYFEGCSNGGRDALILAQRHPEDFDGIISGAPAANWTGLLSSFVMNQRTYEAFGASGQDAKFKIVNAAIMAKCDALDGVTDGVLEQPKNCAFDPSEVQCKTGETSNCLSKTEADALRTMYTGHALADGRTIFPGFAIGAETERSGWRDPSKAGTGQMGIEYYRWMVFGDPNWTMAQFDLDRDFPFAVQRTASIIDATDPDITAFTGKGGKLLLWHGWNDTLIPADGTIDYYDAVKSKLGTSTDESVRLFMAPGVNHCFGGAGPSFFDRLGALDRWVETGTAPDRMIASKFDNDLLKLIGMPSNEVRTRPLCPWPQTAHYSGTGSTDDAANFMCRAD